MTVLNFPADTSQSPYEENGIIYVWDGQAWVTDGSAADEGLWEVNGTNLKPVDDSQNVQIGGGDIQLNADGSGVFAAPIYVGAPVTSTCRIDGEAGLIVQYNTGNQGLTVQQLSSPTGTMRTSFRNAAQTTTAYINHEDGAANFTNSVTVTDSTSPGDWAELSVKTGANTNVHGYLKLYGGGLSNPSTVFRVYDGSDDRITFKGDGSADFYGPLKVMNLGVDRNTTDNSLAGAYFRNAANSAGRYYFVTNGNQTSIGNADPAGANGMIQLFTTGNASFVGTVTDNISDIKFKENIVDAPSQLDEVRQLQLRQWDWKADAIGTESRKARHTTGLVAQEAETVDSKLVYDVGEGDDSFKAIDYKVLTMKLLGAVQELEAARPTHVSFDASAGNDFDFTTAKIASHNVSSVERTAKGKFTITFTNAFASDKYTAVATAGDQDHGGTGASPRCVNVVARTANTLDIVVERSDDAAQDDDGYISVMIVS